MANSKKRGAAQSAAAADAERSGAAHDRGDDLQDAVETDGETIRTLNDVARRAEQESARADISGDHATAAALRRLTGAITDFRVIVHHIEDGEDLMTSTLIGVVQALIGD
jgi:hypothetical protein